MRPPRPTTRTAVALVLMLALGVAAPASGGSSGPPEGHPRLDPNLATTPHETPGWIAVEIHGFDGRPPLAALTGHGASDVVAVGEIVFATVPVAALAAIGDHPRVRWVRPAARPHNDAVTGQGVAATNADAWHTAGIDGTGVKVAVIDSGFAGYTTKQASGDLPPALTTINHCEDFAADDHGTAVAEIVYEMAPGAELYLICVDSGGDVALAVDAAIANGVGVINESMSWFPPGRGDGSGFLGPIVAEAYDAGIVWVNSAGNEAHNHWGGTFVDGDADGWLDFAGSSDAGEKNAFTLAPGEHIFVALRWDDWPASAIDYRVHLYQVSGDTLLTSSGQPQTGTQLPVDYFEYTNPLGSDQALYVKVEKVSASATPEMDLFVTANTDLQPYTTARSLTDPATSPLVTAVGAARWNTGVIETFSSQGPTIAGLIKPELTGPDGVSSATYAPDSFFGTSASSPHVAGAVALIRDANPCLDVSGVNALLADLAIDRGAAGPDNVYGAGLLYLGDPATAVATAGCVLRYAGANRYDTAATISENDFPAAASTVFVATGANFPDGLAGAAVAATFGAPLLLVNSSGVPPETATELIRLGPDTIVILGGTGVIPDEVATDLAPYAATVTRVSGGDRYTTAVAISQYGFPTNGSAAVVFVATGLNFPDALAAGAAAAHLGGPVLLVPGTTLPQAVADEILRLHPATIAVVGGTAVVAPSVFDALDGLQGDDNVIRLSGSDRYATAVAISGFAFPAGAPRAYVATGLNFPDAAAAAAAAGAWSSPVLLVPGTTIPLNVASEIDRLEPALAVVVGGDSAVSAAVEQALEDGLS